MHTEQGRGHEPGRRPTAERVSPTSEVCHVVFVKLQRILPSDRFSRGLRLGS